MLQFYKKCIAEWSQDEEASEINLQGPESEIEDDLLEDPHGLHH